MTDIKKLPKIELHAHLAGSVRAESLKRYGYTAPPFNDLDTGFALFGVIHKYMERPEVLREMTQIVLEDFEQDGVVYLELR